MNLRVPLLLAILLFYCVTAVKSQEDKDLIQFSGVVVDGDSLQPLSFTTILIKNSRRGTISDYYGFFSFVAQPNDTIEFSSVGYKKARFVIPDTLTTNRYSIIQLLFKDTIWLSEAVVYPWPTREQFKEAFMSLNVPDDDLERARKNLEMAEMRERSEIMGMDGSENYKWQMNQYQTRLYYNNQLPPNNLMNPIAWAQFIRAWKEGKFKRTR